MTAYAGVESITAILFVTSQLCCSAERSKAKLLDGNDVEVCCASARIGWRESRRGRGRLDAHQMSGSEARRDQCQLPSGPREGTVPLVSVWKWISGKNVSTPYVIGIGKPVWSWVLLPTMNINHGRKISSHAPGTSLAMVVSRFALGTGLQLRNCLSGPLGFHVLRSMVYH